MLDENGKVQFLIGIIEDITERRVAEEKIAYLAYHDSLTGLANRTAFNEALESAILRYRTETRPFGLILLDLDHFKAANDAYGHPVGDAILREVSRLLVETAENSVVARLGGDEFAIIVLPEATADSLSALCQRMHAAIANAFTIDSVQILIGLSIGVAVCPTDGCEPSLLVSHADAALYRAKLDGRGVTRFFEPAMDAQLRERHALQHDLRQALARNEMFLHYQPQFKTGGGVIGFEALLRWRHPKRGLVSPAAFIPLAEETGIIFPIADWVLEEACREAASWKNPVSVAVNVSALQFKQGDLAARVHSTLLRTGLPANRLEIEITEGVLLNHSSLSLLTLRRLKSLGVRIAMDDFGTGYSSLPYLQSFPFDKIKIDKSFVKKLNGNNQSAAIVRAIIGLGRSLDMPVIAEGVESACQYEFLKQCLCDQVQRYLLGAPLPIAEYDDLVNFTAPMLRVHKQAAG